MPTNIGENRIVEDGIARITEEDANRLGQHRLRAGDIIYSRRGDVEKRALIREREEGWFCGTGCLRVRLGSGIVDPLFASLFLGHPSIREWIVRHAVGATMPNLNTAIMSSVPFALPPLAEQKAIAAVLGALDDKIELNRRMNATLEAMARALFQSWFIDFDPVRRNMDRNQPSTRPSGHPSPSGRRDGDEGASGLLNSPATDALFPDTFQDSDSGEIPKGWRFGTIGNLGERIMDKVDEQSEWASEPLIDLSRMPQGSVALAEWGLGVELTTSVTRFLPKDVLFGAIRPYFHKVGIAPVHGVTNVSVFVIRAKQAFDWAFLAALCSLDSTVEFATRVSKGTKMPVVGWPDFANYSVVIPPPELRQAFADMVSPLYDQIIANLHQSRTLAALRDTLLPKLLSGELSVAAIAARMEALK
jgi:type I restriction enzyme S subunit